MKPKDIETVLDFFDKHYSHASASYRLELKKAFMDYLETKDSDEIKNTNN